MLISNIHDFHKGDYLIVEKALALLQSQDFTKVEDGRIQIDEDTYLQVLSYETQDISAVPFERHHNRLDIHYIAQGSEVIEVAQATTASPLDTYNAERDLEYLEEPEFFQSIVLKRGDFIVIGMDEPHRTNGYLAGKSDFVKKVVVKIRRAD